MQYCALGDGPERYESMGRSALRAALKERGLTYTGRDSVAVLRAKLRREPGFPAGKTSLA